jgi:hypothetical protein
MAKAKNQPVKDLPLDEQGLDPNVRGRILSYGAPDRRKADSKETSSDAQRRRDDPKNAPPRAT